MDNSQGQSFITKTGTVNLNPLTANKITCIYFSAHWCPPCRGFTPVLAEFYNAVNKDKKQLEIIFVTSDKSDEDFKSYYETMPWIAIPFGDARINTLKTKHNVTGIPKLVVLKANGDELVDNGRGDVTSNGVAAFDAWVAKL